MTSDLNEFEKNSAKWDVFRKENKSLRYLLSNDPEKTVSKAGIVLRRLIYPFVRMLGRPMSGVRGVLCHAEPLPKGPKIYAITHTYSREDVVWGVVYAGRQSHLVTNAKRELIYSSDGWGLWASGIILVERYDKENRKAVIKKAKRVTDLGGNVMIFPEGTWNMSPNQVVRKMWPGVYRMARESKVPVVPMGTMMYDGKFYLIRGKALQLGEMEQTEALTLLRDTLATMKWDLMEKYGQTTREELLGGLDAQTYWHNDIEAYIAKQTIYDREDEEHAHFVDESDIAHEEFLHHLDRVTVRRETAFLFRIKSK